MKKTTKTDAQIAAEKREAEELQQKIMRLTNSIPRKVAEGSYQTAVSFKEQAIKARSIASKPGNSGSVSKMRDAWNLISHFYSGQA